MIEITLHDHPFDPAPPQVFHAESLAEWLLDRYGDAPDRRLQIFIGEPSAETEITGDADAILAVVGGVVTVLESPAGGIGIGDVLAASFSWVYIIFAGAKAAASMFGGKPGMPANVNRTQASPNNGLGARENQVRVMERVEDVFGTVLAIPSLMMPTYFKYKGHRKYEYGYYCATRGYADVARIRDADSLIADISGASASVYAPFTSPNSGDAPQAQIGAAIIDAIVTVAQSEEIDGATLKALNQVQLPDVAQYTYTPDAGGDRITQAAKTPNFNAGTAAKTPNFNACTAAGDTLIVTMPDYTYVTDPGDPEADPPVPPTYATVNYSGTYIVEDVIDGEVILTTSSWTGPVIPTFYSTVAISGATDWTDWVTLPSTDRTEVWANLVATAGMYRDAGGGKSLTSVDCTIQIEQLTAGLVPTGTVETVTSTLSGATSDERAETLEHVTAWVGPCRVRARRVTQYDYGFRGTIMDEVKFADLYSVSPVTKTHFGNKTTIHTVTKATPRATSIKSRQLNALVSRKLPIYDGVTGTFSGAFDVEGRHVSGTIAATSRIADILPAVCIDPKIGAMSISEVDMAQIYQVQQKLDAWNVNAGQFNYTLDSDGATVEETIAMIANAAFCQAYRQNGKVRLALDEPQAASVAIFTHRNKKPGSETITRSFVSDSDQDGVEFIYVDPDTEQSETIILPLDGNYTKLKKFELPGIRSYAQAWLRANREYRKLLGQRVTVETTATLDARALLPFSRVDIVDNTRFKSYDGEVVAQTGLEITLSRDVFFTPGQPHSVVLMKRDGTVEGIACTAGSSSNRVILAHAPAEAIVTTPGIDGIRTIFSFASDSARPAMAYSVNELRPDGGQYVTITGQNYSPDFYAMDDEPIPPRDTVIN